MMQLCVQQKDKGLCVESQKGQIAALAFVSKTQGVVEITGAFS